MYREPLLGYVRRWTNGSADAEDLVHGFIESLLDRNRQWFRQADPRRGRFRSFLLTSLKHYLCGVWRRGQAEIRGGRARFVSVDQTDEEGRPSVEPSTDETPDRLYERHWAQTVVERALERLEESYKDQGTRFELLAPHLLKEAGGETYAQVGARLGIAENAVKQQIHRMKERFAAILRSEVRGTVDTDAEVTDETEFLIKALAP